MGGYVGGDTDLISASGKTLGQVADSVHTHATPVHVAASSASGAAGNDAVAGALDRCAAAWSRLLADMATQTRAVGVLADVGAGDLTGAGGGS